MFRPIYDTQTAIERQHEHDRKRMSEHTVGPIAKTNHYLLGYLVALRY